MPDTLDPYDQVDQIKKNMLFHYMSENEFYSLLSKAELNQYSDGEPIITQDDISQDLFGVIRGRVDVSARNHEQDVFIHAIEEGEIFGEAAIFLTELRTASVVSSGEAMIIRIHRNDLVNFIREFSQAGNRILLFIIFSLLKKLRASTKEIAATKHVVMDQQHMESHMKKLMEEL